MALITKKRVVWFIAIGAGLLVGSMATQSMLSQPPENLGLVDGKLRPCPSGSRNCVCSEDHETGRHVPPFKLRVASQQALPAISKIIQDTARAKVIRRETNYLHAEYTSRIFRFVDDVELRLDETTGLVHVRSASRVGKGDLGVNRRRVEDLRSELVQAGIVAN